MPGLDFASSNSKLHPSYLDRRSVLFFLRKEASHYTAHARVMYGTRHAASPNLDDNVPQTCPCIGNPESWQAVPFSKGYFIRMSKEHKHFENWRISNLVQRKTGKSSYPLLPKKKNERTPRATHCRDRAQNLYDRCLRTAGCLLCADRLLLWTSLRT